MIIQGEGVFGYILASWLPTYFQQSVFGPHNIFTNKTFVPVLTTDVKEY